MKVAVHDFIHVEGADLVHEAVRIRVQQLRGLTHRKLHVIVVEAVYEGLGKIQDCVAHIYQPPDCDLCTTQLDSHQVLPEDGSAVEVGLGYECLSPIAPSHLCTSLTSTRLRSFSMVLRYTALLNSLKRSFSKSFYAFFLFSY